MNSLSEILDKIDEMINDWENRMGREDETMYTLGLRRLRDAITGENSLEGEDSDE